MPHAPRLLFLAAALSAGAAYADSASISPEPEQALSFNVGVTSEYRARGIAQTNFNPVLQAGADYALKSGFYAGTLLSNVNWIKDFNGATKGDLEWDVYAGFHDAIEDTDWSFDIGAISYQYPDNNSGAAGTPGAGLFSNASTSEVYLNIGYKMFNLKLNQSVGDYMGSLNSNGSRYYDLNASFTLPNGYTLTPHIGHQSIPNQGANGNAGDYTDYSLTLSKDFGDGLVGSVSAIGTSTQSGAGSFYYDAGNRDLGRSTLTVGLKYTF